MIEFTLHFFFTVNCWISATFPPTRLGIAFMLFATTFVSYIIRVNLSISILGMVRTQQQTENETMKFDLPDVRWYVNFWIATTKYFILHDWADFFFEILSNVCFSMDPDTTGRIHNRALYWAPFSMVTWQLNCWAVFWINCLDRVLLLVLH